MDGISTFLKSIIKLNLTASGPAAVMIVLILSVWVSLTLVQAECGVVQADTGCRLLLRLAQKPASAQLTSS